MVRVDPGGRKKKLENAARHIAQQSYGCLRPDRDYDVWPQNWDAARVFAASITQWRYVGMGSIQGLDYPSVESIMRMLSIEEVEDTFMRIRIMEVEFLSFSREYENRQSGR